MGRFTRGWSFGDERLTFFNPQRHSLHCTLSIQDPEVAIFFRKRNTKRNSVEKQYPQIGDYSSIRTGDEETFRNKHSCLLATSTARKYRLWPFRAITRSGWITLCNKTCASLVSLFCKNVYSKVLCLYINRRRYEFTALSQLSSRYESILKLLKICQI